MGDPDDELVAVPVSVVVAVPVPVVEAVPVPVDDALALPDEEPDAVAVALSVVVAEEVLDCVALDVPVEVAEDDVETDADALADADAETLEDIDADAEGGGGGGGGASWGGGGEPPVVGGPCDVAVADEVTVTLAADSSLPSATVRTTRNDPDRTYVCSTATGRLDPLRAVDPSPKSSAHAMASPSASRAPSEKTTSRGVRPLEGVACREAEGGRLPGTRSSRPWPAVP